MFENKSPTGKSHDRTAVRACVVSIVVFVILLRHRLLNLKGGGDIVYFFEKISCELL